MASLEAIVAEPQCLDPKLEPKLALYKLFLRQWRGLPLNMQADAAPAAETPAARIAALPPEPRIAFLLLALDNFSAHDIADALGLHGPEARELIEKAGARDLRSAPHLGR